MKTARLFNHFRLALFPIAYALSGVLIGSTLNRIMIADLGYPASLVALFFAIPLMVSPVRVWIGYRSDAFPLLGKRREPYIFAGAVLIALGIVAIANLISRASQGTPVLMAGVALAFLLYGLGRNMAHNTFQALVSDRFNAADRSRAVTFYEVATMFGMVAGAGLIKKSLGVYDPARLLSVALGVGLAVFVLAFIGAFKQEGGEAAQIPAAQKAREVPFGDAFRQLVMADPQVRLFFFIVTLTFVGTLAQDVLLEPFGGLVLKMEVGETTGLTQFWGIGVLLSMLVCGAFLLKKIGWKWTMQTGMVLSAVAFLGPIVAGFAGSASLLKAAVFVMGLGTGLAGAGMLSGTLSFTSRMRAGMLLGVWAVANMAGHAFGSLLGGVMVDSLRFLTGNSFVAYGSVFCMEAVMLLAALWMTSRLDLKSSLIHREEANQAALASFAD